MKVILGSVNADFTVRLRSGPMGWEATHENEGIDGDYNFRVVGNVIYWWFRVPQEDIKNEVLARLKRKTGIDSFTNRILSGEMASYSKRFFHCHGYEAP